jgi:hypothetical protein
MQSRTIFEMRQDRRAHSRIPTPDESGYAHRWRWEYAYFELRICPLVPSAVLPTQRDLRTPAELSIGTEAARDVDRQKVAIYSVINRRKMQQDAFGCSDFESTSFS